MAFNHFEDAAAACLALWALDGGGRWAERHTACLLKAADASEAVAAAEASVRELLKAKNFAGADRVLANLIAGLGTGSPPAQRAKWLRNRASCLVHGGGSAAGLAAAEEAARLSVCLEPQNPAAHEMLATLLHKMVTAGESWRIHDEVDQTSETKGKDGFFSLLSLS